MLPRPRTDRASRIPPGSLGRHGGFSLVELLVVISIIALLASMLLAAIGVVRRSARGSNCLSNLHQISLASAAYTSENDGAMVPYWGDNPDGSNNPRYFDFLYPYVRMNSSTKDRNQKKNIYVCPSSIPVKTAPEGGWDWVWTYALNQSVHSNFVGSYPVVYVSQIRNQSDTVDIADCTQNLGDPALNSNLSLQTYSTWVGDTAYYDDTTSWKVSMRSETPDTSAGVIRYRHGGQGFAGRQANIAWVDGHASAVGQRVLVKGKHFAVELR